MTEKLLGKIDLVEYGIVTDYPSFMGLILGFTMSGYEVMSGMKYTVNISPECRWEEAERQDAITKNVEFINGILKDAKVKYVSELIGKPVEVTIERNVFKDFRILTEVL